MKQTFVGLLVLISLLNSSVMAQVERPAVIDQLLRTEPEVGRFVDQWYNQLMEQVQFIKSSQSHWRQMLDSGELTPSDYEFVMNRDVTRSIERLKAGLPKSRAWLKQGIADIRNNNYVLYSFSDSTTLGYARFINVRADGETSVEGQTVAADGTATPESQTLVLSPQQMTELNQSVMALQPLVKDVPPLLGQGFTSITVYNGGEFITYDHYEQPQDRARDNLITLVESWID